MWLQRGSLAHICAWTCSMHRALLDTVLDAPWAAGVPALPSGSAACPAWRGRVMLPCHARPCFHLFHHAGRCCRQELADTVEGAHGCCAFATTGAPAVLEAGSAGVPSKARLGSLGSRTPCFDRIDLAHPALRSAVTRASAPYCEWWDLLVDTQPGIWKVCVWTLRCCI